MGVGDENFKSDLATWMKMSRIWNSTFLDNHNNYIFTLILDSNLGYRKRDLKPLCEDGKKNLVWVWCFPPSVRGQKIVELCQIRRTMMAINQSKAAEMHSSLWNLRLVCRNIVQVKQHSFCPFEVIFNLHNMTMGFFKKKVQN